MSDYTGEYASAYADIAAAGAAVTFALQVEGAYDAATDTAAAAYTVTVSGVMMRVKGDPAERYAVANLTQTDRATVLFCAANYGDQPPLGATCTFGGAQYVVRDVAPLAPDGRPILSRLILAGGGVSPLVGPVFLVLEALALGATGGPVYPGSTVLGTGSLSLAATGDNGKTFYVNSVSGSDARTGRTLGTAKATIAAVQAVPPVAGDALYEVNGSTWREQFNIPADSFIIGTAGSGTTVPVMSGADVLPSTWTQPDSTNQPNVWAQSFTRAVVPTSGSEALGYWENGVRPRFATNATTDLQTSGGWYSTAVFSQTSTISIKSTANPNNDGILREASKRQHGINGHVTTNLVTRTMTITGPLEIKQCVGHYNGLSMGLGTAKYVLVRDGNIHHFTSQASLLEDCIGTEYSPQIAPSVFVNYQPSGIGFNPVNRRCLAIQPGGANRVTGSNSAFFAHSSTTQEVASFTIEGGLSIGLNFANADAQLLTILGGYCEDANQSVVSASAVLTDARYVLARDTAATPLAAGNAFLSRLATIGTFAAQHCAAHTMKGASVRNVTGGTKPTLANCAINNPAAIGLSGGEFGVTNSIFFCAGRVMDNVVNTSTGDFNVYYTSSQTSPVIQWGGVLYSSVTTSFSDYVTASGQDTHSVYLKPADQTASNPLAFWLGISSGANNGPADGDFRINPNCRVYDRTNTARIGVFGDLTTPITNAGPQFHYDFNTRTVVAGPPSRYPIPPLTIADMRTYITTPTAWNFYP